MPPSSTASPMRKPTIRTARSPTCIGDLGAGKPMDRLVCGDVGFGKTEVALRAAFVAAMAGPAGRAGRADHPARPPAFHRTSASASRASRSRSAASRASCPPAEAKETKEGARRRARSTSSSAPMRSSPRAIEFKKLGLVIVDEEQRFGVTHKERLKALQRRRPCADADRDADPAHAADGDVGPARAVGDPDPAGRPPRGAHLRHALGPGRGPRGAAARTLSRRPELLRRAAHRRPARHRAIPARGGARGPLRHRPRPDGADRGRGADVGLLRPQIRGAALDHDHRERARHPERQHADRPPRRPLRPRPALPAARPRRPGEDPRLCLSHHAAPTGC